MTKRKEVVKMKIELTVEQAHYLDLIIQGEGERAMQFAKDLDMKLYDVRKAVKARKRINEHNEMYGTKSDIQIKVVV